MIENDYCDESYIKKIRYFQDIFEQSKALFEMIVLVFVYRFLP